MKAHKEAVTMNKLLSSGLALGITAAIALPLVALAKLPPLTPEGMAKADETKAKAAWTDKVGTYQLCQAQNKIAAKYAKTAASGAGAAAVPAPTPASAPAASAAGTPACADPGPYVAMVAAAAALPSTAASAPPLESAGAHSPAKTAIAPPNEKATAAEQKGEKK